MAKKNGTPKSRTRKSANLCGCYYCTGTEYEEWMKLKHNLNPKHKKDHTKD